MSKVDVRGIGGDSRLRMLRFLKDRYGYRGLYRLLGTSPSTVHRYLSGQRDILDKLLNILSSSES